MHEHPPSWFSLRRVLGSTLLFVAGLIFGVALCKEFWPTIQEREVPVVSYIDRRVEVPVEKIVERILEKRVEVPVVKEVIRYVDRPVVAAPAPAADGPSRSGWVEGGGRGVPPPFAAKGLSAAAYVNY